MSTQPKAQGGWRALRKKPISVAKRGVHNKWENKVYGIVNVAWPKVYDIPAKGTTFETTTLVVTLFGTMPTKPLTFTVQDKAKATVDAQLPPFPMTRTLVAGETASFKLSNRYLSVAPGTIVELISLHGNYSYSAANKQVYGNLEVGAVVVMECIQPQNTLFDMLTSGGFPWPHLKVQTDLTSISEIPAENKYGTLAYLLKHTPNEDQDAKDALFDTRDEAQLTEFLLTPSKVEFINGNKPPKPEDKDLRVCVLATTARVFQWKNGGDGGYDAAPEADRQVFHVSFMIWPEQIAMRISNPEVWPRIAFWLLPQTPFGVLFSEDKPKTRSMPFYTEPDNDAEHPEGVTDMMVAQVSTFAIDMPRAYLTHGIPLTYEQCLKLLTDQETDLRTNKWHPVDKNSKQPVNVMSDDVINLTEHNGDLMFFREGYSLVALPQFEVTHMRLSRAYVRANKRVLRCLFDADFLQRYVDAMGNDDDDVDTAAAVQAFVASEKMVHDKSLFAVLRNMETLPEIPKFSVFAIRDADTRYKRTAGSEMVSRVLDALAPDTTGAIAAMTASFVEQAECTNTKLLLAGKREAPADGAMQGATKVARRDTSESESVSSPV